MAKPGPKPGFKQTAQAAAEATPPDADQPGSRIPSRSASDRENPSKLTGDDLRELAYRRGLARSQLSTMSDEKIRDQLRYITYNQYENNAVV